jgi:hypothetical protein
MTVLEIEKYIKQCRDRIKRILDIVGLEPSDRIGLQTKDMAYIELEAFIARGRSTGQVWLALFKREFVERMGMDPTPKDRIRAKELRATGRDPYQAVDVVIDENHPEGNEP